MQDIENSALIAMRDAILVAYKFGEEAPFDELGISQEYLNFYLFGLYLFDEYSRIESENYATYYSQYSLVGPND